MPLTRARALELAREAGAYTRGELANGNDNPYEGLPGSACRIDQTIAVQMVSTMRAVAIDRTLSPLGIALCRAKVAIGAKCGNCGEHACVALSWLFRNGIHPIALIHAPAEYDHAFVVIGDPCSEDAAICDPWANRYLSLSDVEVWKHAIWSVPPASNYSFSAPVTVHAPGSDEHYQRMTNEQATYVAMDLS